jgi:hypothetical protein
LIGVLDRLKVGNIMLRVDILGHRGSGLLRTWARTVGKKGPGCSLGSTAVISSVIAGFLELSVSRVLGGNFEKLVRYYIV